MTLSTFESVIFSLYRKRRLLLYEVSPFWELFLCFFAYSEGPDKLALRSIAEAGEQTDCAECIHVFDAAEGE